MTNVQIISNTTTDSRDYSDSDSDDIPTMSAGKFRNQFVDNLIIIIL